MSAKRRMGPPPLDKEAMIAEHEKYLKWAHSEEGQRFLKEHMPPETYEEMYGKNDSKDDA